MKKENIKSIESPAVKVFNIISKKGGVGKTTIAIGLSLICKKYKHQPLLFDLDFEGTQLGAVLGTGSSRGFSFNKLLFSPVELPSPNLQKCNIEYVGDIPFFTTRTNPKNAEIAFRHLYFEGVTGFICARLQKFVIDWCRMKEKKKSVGPARPVTLVLDNGPGIAGISRSLLHTEFELLRKGFGKLVLWNIFVTSPEQLDLAATQEEVEDYFNSKKKMKITNDLFIGELCFVNRFREKDNSRLQQFRAAMEKGTKKRKNDSLRIFEISYNENLVNANAGPVMFAKVVRQYILDQLREPLEEIQAL